MIWLDKELSMIFKTKSKFCLSRLNKIVSNQLLSNYYNQMAKDLEISEPKHPDQIYKTYLEDKKGTPLIINLIINKDWLLLIPPKVTWQTPT